MSQCLNVTMFTMFKNVTMLQCLQCYNVTIFKNVKKSYNVKNVTM